MSYKRKLADKAWVLFSKYIRLKNSNDGYCNCYTCGSNDHWKNMHCGHFIPGRMNSVLLNENCVRVQCRYCNLVESGNYKIFHSKIIEEIGEDEFSRLFALKNQSKKLGIEELENFIEKTKADVHALTALQGE